MAFEPSTLGKVAFDEYQKYLVADQENVLAYAKEMGATDKQLAELAAVAVDTWDTLPFDEREAWLHVVAAVLEAAMDGIKEDMDS